MTETPIEQPENPTDDEISPIESPGRAGALRPVWRTVRPANPSDAKAGELESTELRVDLSEIVTTTTPGGGVPVTRTLAENVCTSETGPKHNHGRPDRHLLVHKRPRRRATVPGAWPPVTEGLMTTDRMPPRPWAVTRPRPPTAPEAYRRAARVRPYHRYQEHHPSRQATLARPAGQVEPMRDRAVLERVLTGLRALGPQSATPAAITSGAPSLSLPPLAGSSAATGTTGASPRLVVVSGGDAPPVPAASPTEGASVRSVLGRELVPLVRAVLARRPEAALPAARVEPSPDAIRTQPLSVVGVGS